MKPSANAAPGLVGRKKFRAVEGLQIVTAPTKDLNILAGLLAEGLVIEMMQMKVLAESYFSQPTRNEAPGATGSLVKYFGPEGLPMFRLQISGVLFFGHVEPNFPQKWSAGC